MGYLYEKGPNDLAEFRWLHTLSGLVAENERALKIRKVIFFVTQPFINEPHLRRSRERFERRGWRVI